MAEQLGTTNLILHTLCVAVTFVVLMPVLIGSSRGCATRSVNAAVERKLTPWEQYAQVLLLSNEFAFVD